MINERPLGPEVPGWRHWLAQMSQFRAQMGRWFSFFREMIRHPIQMGAVCPSSKVLAHAMASFVPLPEDGEWVIEVGAGTGAVTGALLAQGVDPGRLIVVERSDALAELLKKRFPQLNVLVLDVAHLDWEHLGATGDRVAAIVSSLPLRSLPKSLVRSIGSVFDNLSDPETLIVQFTYQNWGSGEKILPSHFKRIGRRFVWANIPPARVDVYAQSGTCIGRSHQTTVE